MSQGPETSATLARISGACQTQSLAKKAQLCLCQALAREPRKGKERLGKARSGNYDASFPQHSDRARQEQGEEWQERRCDTC